MRIGPRGRQLVAMHHPAATSASRRGVVFCNPFGQEAIRTHRLLRVLADRLAAAGFHVLRFDYFGTGDSEGDETGATLDRWIDDVQLADAMLRSEIGVNSSAWFGARLGATIAMLASRRGAPPERLVCWDPVLDGRAYLDEIDAAHREAGRDLPASVADTFGSEVLGFCLPERMRQAIAAIRPSALGCEARSVHVVAGMGHRGTEEWAPAASVTTRVSVKRIESNMVWMANSGMNGAVVPQDGMAAVVEALGLPA